MCECVCGARLIGSRRMSTLTHICHGQGIRSIALSHARHMIMIRAHTRCMSMERRRAARTGPCPMHMHAYMLLLFFFRCIEPGARHAYANVEGDHQPRPLPCACRVCLAAAARAHVCVCEFECNAYAYLYTYTALANTIARSCVVVRIFSCADFDHEELFEFQIKKVQLTST